MAENPNGSIDPQSGYNSKTKTFHSLRPPVQLPPPSDHLSITQYTVSLLLSNTTTPPDTTTFLIDAATGNRLSFSDFLNQVENLSSSLRRLFPSSSLRKGDVAFVLSPTSLSVPVLFFSLLSLGVVLSPANPLSTESEIARQVRLSKPVVAFATSSTAHKLPKLELGTILLDSPEFDSMINHRARENVGRVNMNQSDTVAILYSSRTTGRVKGVMLTHRNLIVLIGRFFYLRSLLPENSPHSVSLFPLPLFHVFGFFILVRAAASGETLVVMEKFDFEKMLKAVEGYRVTYMEMNFVFRFKNR